jgi:hypothetical protein
MSDPFLLPSQRRVLRALWKLDKRQRGYAWSLREIGRASKLPRTTVEVELDHLESLGFVEIEEGYSGNVSHAEITQAGAVFASRPRWSFALGSFDVEVRASIFAVKIARRATGE